jgi:hypothetical protein
MRFRDAEHLARLAGLFLAGAALFVVLRAALVPDDFGVYGHYRAGAWRTTPPVRSHTRDNRRASSVTATPATSSAWVRTRRSPAKPVTDRSHGTLPAK